MTPSRDERLRALEGAVTTLSEMEESLEELSEDLKGVALPNLALGAAELQGRIRELRERADQRLGDERPPEE